MLLQVKSGCFAERIQLEICTRSLSVFESVFLKELKWNWAPSAEDNVKMCALQGTFPITVSFKQQKAQMWLLWECAEDVIMLFFPSAEKTMSAAHQAHWSVFAVIPSRPCLCWKLSTCSWCRAWASPGHREPSGSWYCQGQFCAGFLLQAGSVWERTIWLFFPCFGVLKVWVFGYPGCPLLSLQDVCCQIQMSLLFTTFCHRSSTMFWLLSLFYRWEMPHNEHGDIYSSSFLLVLNFLLLEPNCKEKASGDQVML